MATTTQLLDTLRAQLTSIMSEAESALSRLERLELSLPRNEAPFEPLQLVCVKGGKGRATVLACEKAFGDWVVQVRFAPLGKVYTYPANELEAA